MSTDYDYEYDLSQAPKYRNTIDQAYERHDAHTVYTRLTDITTSYDDLSDTAENWDDLDDGQKYWWHEIVQAHHQANCQLAELPLEHRLRVQELMSQAREVIDLEAYAGWLAGLIEEAKDDQD